MKEKQLIEKMYGHRLRLRVCGICIEQDRILMVRHAGLGEKGEMWIPPGGGMEWGQSAPENLQREIKEETGLEVKTGELMFVHEHLQEPLHSLELFFKVYPLGGHLTRGYDPEFPPEEQIIKEVRYFHFEELKQLEQQQLHAMFRHYNSLEGLNNAQGYFKFGK